MDSPNAALVPTREASLSPEALLRASQLLSRAFFADPFFRRVQPSDARRRGALPTVFRACVRHALRSGGLYLTLEAALAWLPLRDLDVGLKLICTAGYYAIPFRLGLFATLRMQRHEQWCERRWKEHALEDAAYVYCLGVEPDLAGKGVGSRAVREVLAQMATRHEHCVLRTEQPRNVHFYEKLGFHCVEEVVVPVTGLRAWFFTRSLADLRA